MNALTLRCILDSLKLLLPIASGRRVYHIRREGDQPVIPGVDRVVQGAKLGQIATQVVLQLKAGHRFLLQRREGLEMVLDQQTTVIVSQLEGAPRSIIVGPSDLKVAER